MNPVRLAGMAAALAALHAAPAWAETCKIALDVGHSRTQPGATSARGVGEWRFNQILALKTAQALSQNGIQISIINPEGNSINLKERPAAAQAAGADVLLSFHHDSVQPQYLTPWVQQGRKLQYSDRFSGYGLFISAKNPKFAASRAMAEALADSFLQAGLTPSLHHAEAVAGENRTLLDPARGLYQFDDLVVLKYAQMPAVLIEAGIIVNRDQEIQVSSDSFQTAFAQATLKAIRSYCRNLALRPVANKP